MWTAEGGRKECGLVWEAGTGVDCSGGQEVALIGEGGKMGCALLRGVGGGVNH